MITPALVAAALLSSTAQAAPKAPPRAMVTLPAPDLPRLLAEDTEADGDLTKPFRFGVAHPVDLDPSTFGRWTLRPDGSRVWRAVIRSPGAFHLNLQFDDFHLADGATLTLTSPAHGTETYTARHNQPHRRLGTTPIRGDRLVLELIDPPTGRSDLHLASVVHGYRDLYAHPGLRGFGDSGACNHNAACPVADGYRLEVASAVMTVAPTYACSGTLINNTREDGTPYILTANHCLSRDVSDWVFWFNYESPDCTDPPTEPTPDVIHGATLRASSDHSDFALLEAGEPVDPSFGAYFAGWDHTGVAPSSAIAIHFPANDIKKFSREDDAVVTDPSDEAFWQIRDWDVGTTEGGSSGSGLYDPDGRIIGQLYGGYAACGNDESDYYGKFSVSWDAGSTPFRRLRDWLDPDGVSTGTLDGRPTAAHQVDAALVRFVTPEDAGTACEVEPVVRVANRGLTPLTRADVAFSVDGGPPQTVTWTGHLATGREDDLSLPVTIAALGPHTLTATIAVLGDGPDENPANDTVTAAFTVHDPDGAPLPFSADFDTGLGGVEIVEVPADGTTWAPIPVDRHGDGDQALGMDNLDADTSATVDLVRLPDLDLSDAAAPVLRFDVAYASYGGGYDDGLRVFAVDPCDGSRTLLYERFGDDLATAGPTEERFLPTPSEWRTEEIDLSGFGLVRIELENVGGYGQWLYLDDVRVFDAANGDPLLPDDTASEGVTGCTCATGTPHAGWLVLGLAGLALRRRRGHPA